MAIVSSAVCSLPRLSPSPFIFKATAPSELWIKDLDALGEVLDDIAEITRKQDVEDAKQRKNAGKRKVRRNYLRLIS